MEEGVGERGAFCVKESFGAGLRLGGGSFRRCVCVSVYVRACGLSPFAVCRLCLTLLPFSQSQLFIDCVLLVYRLNLQLPGYGITKPLWV